MDKCVDMTVRDLKKILADHNIDTTRIKYKKDLCAKLVELGYFKERNTFDFNALPSVMRYDVISKLEPKELLRLCASHKSSKEICADDSLWERLFKKEFGKRQYTKEKSETWYQLYKDFVEYPYEIAVFDDAAPGDSTPEYSSTSKEGVKFVLFKRGTQDKYNQIILPMKKLINVTKAKVLGGNPELRQDNGNLPSLVMSDKNVIQENTVVPQSIVLIYGSPAYHEYSKTHNVINSLLNTIFLANCSKEKICVPGTTARFT